MSPRERGCSPKEGGFPPPLLWRLTGRIAAEKHLTPLCSWCVL